MKFKTALLTLAMCMVLVPLATAKPKDDKGKPADGATTFSIGEVVCTDDRILDVTGDYELAAAGSTVSLSLTQDDRGRVTGEATILSDDGSSTGPITVNGHLQLTAQKNLRLQLNGSAQKVSLNIRGNWDGTAFQLTVKIGGAVPSSQVVALTPVNTERGFTIEDAAGTPQGKKQIRSTRTVQLPWGTVTDKATEDTRGSSLSFKIKNSKFGIDLRGTVEANTTFTANRAQVKVGYGNVRVDLDSLTVTTSTQTTK